MDSNSNPYAAPVSNPAPVVAQGRMDALKDPRMLGKLTVGFVALFCLLRTALSALGWADPQRELVEGVGYLELEAISGVLLLPAGVLGVVWTYRAAKNAWKMEKRNMSPSPGWAAGSYFVPFYNLFGPCQAMFNIVAITFRNAPKKNVKMWILPWWICWLLFNWHTSFASESTDPAIIWFGIIAGDLAGLFYVILVIRISSAQAGMKLPEVAVGISNSSPLRAVMQPRTSALPARRNISPNVHSVAPGDGPKDESPHS